MKLTQTQVLWGIILTAVAFAAGGIIAFTNAEADIEPESKAEIYNFIKDTYVSQADFEKYQEEVEAAIAHPHVEFDSIATSIKNLREDVNEVRIDVARVKISQGGTGTPSQGTISATTEQACYKLGELVQINGMATPSRQLTSSIYQDKDIFEASPTTNTNSNGSFTLFWVIPNDIDTGTYIVKLKDSGGKFGETIVSIRTNC